MVIQTFNNQTVNTPQTFLTNTVNSGDSVLGWKNPSGFSANYAIQLGKTGEEQTEIVILGASTPAGTAGTITGTLLYPHPVDTPIYAIKYDQLVFEVSTTGTSGIAAPLTNGTIGIQADSEFTQFDHTTGATSYAYRTYYRNSVLNATSTESDWTMYGTVPSFYSLASIRQRVKDKVFDAGYIKDDGVIDNWINEWLEQMNNVAVSVNEGYSIGTSSLAFSTGTTSIGTITNPDFKNLQRAFWVNYTGTYMMNKMDANSFSPQKGFTESQPYFDLSGDNVVEIRPENIVGTMVIQYSKLPAKLLNDNDELPTVMRGYTKSFVDYGLSQALWKDSKIDLAQSKEQLALGALNQFKVDITPAVRTQPTMIQVVEAVGDDTPWWI